MDRLGHPATRTVIALVVGVPGTLTLGWMALFLTEVAAFGIPYLAFQATQGHLRSGYLVGQLGWTLLNLGWGIAGILGVAGFWTWVLSPRPLSPRKRTIVAIMLVAGIVAASPVIVTGPEGWFQWLAIIGVVIAAVLIAELCFLTSRSSGP